MIKIFYILYSSEVRYVFVQALYIDISLPIQIGQEAFRNCKTLNRIQTVVYPVAYHSNENLLICAPTGAGKTNIAMLTVVHQIRQHLEAGVIQKDKFKVSKAILSL